MRILIITICFFIFSSILSQEFNIGIQTGTDIGIYRYGYIMLGTLTEYRPPKALFSFNGDILFINHHDDFMVMTPIYLKAIIGKSIRFTPLIGGFINSKKGYGWNLGFDIDLNLNKRIALFIAFNRFKNYWKDITPKGDEYVNSNIFCFVHFGCKYHILE